MTQVHNIEPELETAPQTPVRFQTWGEIPYHWDVEAIRLDPPWREDELLTPTEDLEDIPL